MNTTYQCRQLLPDEVIEIYTHTSVRHFPKAELKPVENVRNYFNRNQYQGYGFFAGDMLLAYAFFVILQKDGYRLLDYYAVLEEYRNTGIGSDFLQALRDCLTDCKGIYIESENPDCSADETEKAIRTKRIAFYHRNGAVSTNIRSRLFGVPYQILYLPTSNFSCKAASCKQPDFLAELDTIYHVMFPPEVYSEKIQLY